MSLLSELYYDPVTGYQATEELLRRAIAIDPTTTRQEVNNFLRGQATAQINRASRKPIRFNTIRASAIRDGYQLDLMIYDRFKSNGYSYILIIIDVYSRYVQAVPLKTRLMEPLVKNIEKLFTLMGFPRNVNCDQEFNNRLFNKLCTTHNIRTWYSDPDEPNKNAIVERFNRTLAQLLQRWRVATDRTDWENVLQDLVTNYNTKLHSTTKNTPEDIWKGVASNLQAVVNVPTKLKKGDRVRLATVRTKLTKGDAVKWTRELFRIERVEGQRYYVEGSKTGFKEYELLHVPTVEGIAPQKNQRAQAVTVRKRRMQVREFGQSHEVKQVLDDGTVIYKDRLTPKNVKRSAAKAK